MVGAGKVLLVATGGGHLGELRELAPRVSPAGWSRAWVVPAGAQADELADAGEPVHAIRPTGPRDWRSTAANTRPLWRVLAAERPTAVVSTGAAVAVPALALAGWVGAEAHYVESAARTEGPSLTGRILQATRRVHLYTQWPEWAGARWAAAGSVFDPFRAYRRPVAPPVRRLVVTLGTQAGYSFGRLVERLASVVPPGVDVLWQVGPTDARGLGLSTVASLPPASLAAEMSRADAVVAHAGIGSALAALSCGRRPVLVPRRLAFGEHVDDHQSLIGRQVAEAQLAMVAEADRIDWETIVASAAWEVRAIPTGPLRLQGQLGRALRAGPGTTVPLAQ
jgi:UDP-N-acetylglucosamine--N-acetylmuramyl-(pentapeptide) pyrophosphoryl-undecaprenol N-acetylglucosamine transferase